MSLSSWDTTISRQSWALIEGRGVGSGDTSFEYLVGGRLTNMANSVLDKTDPTKNAASPNTPPALFSYSSIKRSCERVMPTVSSMANSRRRRTVDVRALFTMFKSPMRKIIPQRL